MNKVLIIDQVTPIVRRIKKTCKELNLEFFDASSEYEAVNCFIENIDDIKVVIVDVSMNNFDGFRILKKIRHVSRDVKIIVLTSLNTRNYFVNCLKIGINDYVLKPFDDKFIKTRIALALPDEIEIVNAHNFDQLKIYFDEYYSLTLGNLSKLYVFMGVFYKKEENNVINLISNKDVGTNDFKNISCLLPDKSIFSVCKSQSYIGILPDTDDNVISKFIKDMKDDIKLNNINFIYEGIIISGKEKDFVVYDGVVEKLEKKIMKKIKFTFSNVGDKKILIND